ncbi:mechanosensitive ion channel family protein [Nocardia wallacei]|uniref:mechanosensitive ion channel family protein n=1 Tax=Nocardia wallacei TaxID=480035 RepID=UPI003CC7D1C1
MAIDFQQGMSNAWSAIATFVPKFVGFLVVLAIGWIIAKVIAKIADRVLRRVGFDRLVERGGIQNMLANSRYDATDILVKLVYYAILLIALQIGFGVFGPNPVSNMLNGIVAWLPRAAVAIIIVCVAGAIARVVMDLIGNVLSGLSYGRMLGRLAAVFIWGVGIIAALNQIGVATSVTTPILITVLATIGGILVVGIGGGLIRPMQQRWEGWLDTVEGEMPQLRGHAEAYQRGREDAARQREGVATRQEEWAGSPRPGDQWSPQTSGAGYRPETGGMTEPGYGGQSGQGYGQGYGEAPGYGDPQSPR